MEEAHKHRKKNILKLEIRLQPKLIGGMFTEIVLAHQNIGGLPKAY